MTRILYNNKQIISGQPIPFVSKENSIIRYGEKWAEKNNITLHGQITGCSFIDLINAQNQLLEDFSKDFQNLIIEESGIEIYKAPYSIIRSVNFEQSSYKGIVGYTVNLECYQDNLFSGVYGIVEPSDEWNFEETKDGLVNLTHTISARGFNTSSANSNSLQNAIVFVNSKTGISSRPNPFFINSGGGLSFCLKSISENIDRFNSTYSITENYTADKYFGVGGVLRYTTDFDCDLNGFASVLIKGEIDGCGLYSDISTMRNRYNSLDIYNIALDFYSGSTGRMDLNEQYVSSGVTEDIYSRKLTFNINFDNSKADDVYLDYSVNMESGDNGIITVNFNGSIKGRGDLKNRWDKVSGYYSTFNPYPYGVSGYMSFGGTGILNPNPTESGVTFNKFAGEIVSTATWSDKEIPPSGFEDFNYTLSYSPSIQAVKAIPLPKICDKAYYVVDLGYCNRSQFSIEGDAKIKCGTPLSSGIPEIKNFANDLFGSECPKNRPLLEINEITTGNSSISFKFGWTAESTPIALYSFIDKLNLI